MNRVSDVAVKGKCLTTFVPSVKPVEVSIIATPLDSTNNSVAVTAPVVSNENPLDEISNAPAVSPNLTNASDASPTKNFGCPVTEPSKTIPSPDVGVTDVPPILNTSPLRSIKVPCVVDKLLDFICPVDMLSPVIFVVDETPAWILIKS